MTSGKTSFGHRFIARTPLSECSCAALFYGLLLMPTAASADSGGQVEGISGDLWYIGSLGHSNNNVSIDTDSTSSYTKAAGGYSGDGVNSGGNVRKNTLTLEDGAKVKDYTYGGYARSSSKTATVRDNAVFIDNDGTTVKRAYGGRARSVDERTVVSGNSLTVSNGAKVSSEAYGGLAQTTAGTASAEFRSIIRCRDWYWGWVLHDTWATDAE
ncbi:MAG: hypothetical protein J6M93_02570 [Succinivibrio sp.]|nr:hypothetical protein [Succinivibrio sp.]